MSSLQVQGILFDLDGVLIDSTAGVTRVWRDWAIRHGLDPDTTAHTAHGRRAIDTVRLLAPQLDAEAELRDLERRKIADSYDVTVFRRGRQPAASACRPAAGPSSPAAPALWPATALWSPGFPFRS